MRRIGPVFFFMMISNGMVCLCCKSSYWLAILQNNQVNVQILLEGRKAWSSDLEKIREARTGGSSDIQIIPCILGLL
jgi:hypothetical protein